MTPPMQREPPPVNGTPCEAGQRACSCLLCTCWIHRCAARGVRYAAWTGPCEGGVSTTWTPGEGILIHLEGPEDLSRSQAEQLLVQLSKVLEQLAAED